MTGSVAAIGLSIHRCCPDRSDESSRVFVLLKEATYLELGDRIRQSQSLSSRPG